MLSTDQKKLYSRNIAVPGVGTEGQEALLESKVLVIGSGGLGSPVLYYLAAAGVGTIGIVDFDKVELSNLQRQIIHNYEDIGRHKAASASQKITNLNPALKTNIYSEKLREENANSIIAKYDIIADCSDNFSTRLIVNKYSYLNKKILVTGAVIEFKGQVASFKSQPCYQCFMPKEPDVDILPTCSNGGVIGSVCGVVGSLQATEIIKQILQIGDNLTGKLLIFDALSNKHKIVKINRNGDCKICGN